MSTQTFYGRYDTNNKIMKFEGEDTKTLRQQILRRLPVFENKRF